MGGKANNLKKLLQIISEHVPDFEVIDPQNEDLEASYKKISTVFSEDEPVVFRSSANLEDSHKTSFAGIFDSYINIKFTRKNFEVYIKKINDQINSDTVKAYKKFHKIEDKVEMNVIIQRMFPSLYSGVAFWYGKNNSRNTLSYGSSEAVTVGEATLELSNPENNVQALPRNVAWQKLFELLNTILENFKEPQDIEWGISRSGVAIFQTRPITKDIKNQSIQEHITFDATNIGENYPGTTAPLTYSFIREAYENVYKQFLKILGVKPSVINDNGNIFRNMLGYINGHVYYNISSWYEMLQLLPFYKSNKQFFENMLTPVKENTRSKKIHVSFSFFAAYRLVFYNIFPERFYKKFQKQFDKAMKLHQTFDFTQMSTNDLITNYRIVQQKFFEVWGFTILNDFRVMIYFGILTKLGKRYIKNFNTYSDSLTSGNSYPYSVQILEDLKQMGQMIQINQEYLKLFSNSKSDQIWNNLQKDEFSELRITFTNYLKKYGNRSANELKIEEPKFNETPEKLIELVKHYIGKWESTDKQDHKKVTPQVSIFLAPIISYLEEETIRSIYKREEYRVKRGEVFGLTRRFFLLIGERFKKNSIIESKEDIFLLYLHEIENIIQFSSLPIQNIKSNIENRKNFLQKNNKVSYPTRIITESFNVESPFLIDDTIQTNNLLIGKITSNYGTIEGEVVIMEVFDPSVDIKDKILVCKRTDPGWTVLFPLIKGLIVERGNTLSHASIISRELGKTCIVNVKNATRLLASSSKVRINTSLAQVEIV